MSIDQNAADHEPDADEDEDLRCENCGEHLDADESYDDVMCYDCFRASLPTTPTPAQQAQRDAENEADMLDFLRTSEPTWGVADEKSIAAGLALFADLDTVIALAPQGVTSDAEEIRYNADTTDFDLLRSGVRVGSARNYSDGAKMLAALR